MSILYINTHMYHVNTLSRIAPFRTSNPYFCWIRGWHVVKPPVTYICVDIFWPGLLSLFACTLRRSHPDLPGAMLLMMLMLKGEGEGWEDIIILPYFKLLNGEETFQTWQVIKLNTDIWFIWWLKKNPPWMYQHQWFSQVVRRSYRWPQPKRSILSFTIRGGRSHRQNGLCTLL